MYNVPFLLSAPTYNNSMCDDIEQKCKIKNIKCGKLSEMQKNGIKNYGVPSKKYLNLIKLSETHFALIPTSRECKLEMLLFLHFYYNIMRSHV